MIIGAQKAPWLRQPAGYVAHPRFESWMENASGHAACLALRRQVESAARIDTTNLSVLAASASGTPLIVASESPRWIQLTFDLQASDFPYHAGFPIFLDNAIAWFGRERLALRRAPGIVEIPLAESRSANNRWQARADSGERGGNDLRSAGAGTVCRVERRRPAVRRGELRQSGVFGYQQFQRSRERTRRRPQGSRSSATNSGSTCCAARFC